jgi:hypothetical protein
MAVTMGLILIVSAPAEALASDLMPKFCNKFLDCDDVM